MKRSVTLDEDLVAMFGDNLSSRLNGLLRQEARHLRHQAALGELLADLDRTEGPLDPDDDPEWTAAMVAALGGADLEPGVERAAADPAPVEHRRSA